MIFMLLATTDDSIQVHWLSFMCDVPRITNATKKLMSDICKRAYLLTHSTPAVVIVGVVYLISEIMNTVGVPGINYI